MNPDTYESIGPVEVACRRDLDKLVLSGHMAATLAAQAVRLARELDSGPRNGVAMTARELRETIKALGEVSEDDEDTRSLHADLSSPV